VLSSTIPNCVSYDPTYGYEVAVIVREGLRRMVAEQEDVFYYLTLMNENYPHPEMPEGAEEGVLKGIHRIAGDGKGAVQLLGSGTILREVEAGAELLRSDFGVDSDVWSVTSFTELRRDGIEADRDNRLHPTREPRTTYVQECLGGSEAPVVAATDYIRTLPDLIRPWVDAPYTALGTDGFGRSDFRRHLRSFFEVDRHHVCVAALHALGRGEDAAQAIAKYEIDAEAVAPWRR
jgi:pyruvate dehydrogenase E1 component